VSSFPRRYFPLLVWLLILATAAIAQTATEQTDLSSLRRSFSRMNNQKVKVEGTVTQHSRAKAGSTSFYTMKDDLGGLMTIRTTNPLPLVEGRYVIEGPLSKDPQTGEIFISEESRTQVVHEADIKVTPTTETVSPQDPLAGKAKGAAVPATGALDLGATDSAGSEKTATATDDSDEKLKDNNLLKYGLILGAILAVVAAVVIMNIRSRREEIQTGDFILNTAIRAEVPPAPEQVVEGKTIKLHAPPPNTVKLQPGWFEVAAGDDVVKQIRLYNLGGDGGAETTFGRASGRPYVHIQLKAPTVSSRQAKVFYDAGKARIINLASEASNPTRINGRELAVNESVALQENDRVEMGEVSLVFHEKAAQQTI
jgi:hypothetical protein